MKHLNSKFYQIWIIYIFDKIFQNALIHTYYIHFKNKYLKKTKNA
jgi:hypothetical protein